MPELHAEKYGGQRADARQRAKDGQAHRAAGARVQRRGDAGDGDHGDLDDQSGLVAPADLRPHGDDVPDPGEDQHAEGGPGDLIEPPGGGARDLGAQTAQDRDERREGDLPADPDGRGEDVHEQPDGIPADGEHPSSFRRAAAPARRPPGLPGPGTGDASGHANAPDGS